MYLNPVQFNSVAQSCPTLCNPTYCSTSGLHVHHQLPEFTQTYLSSYNDLKFTVQNRNYICTNLIVLNCCIAFSEIDKIHFVIFVKDNLNVLGIV